MDRSSVCHLDAFLSPGRHTKTASEAAIETYRRPQAGTCRETKATKNLLKGRAAQTLIDDLCRALDSKHEGVCRSCAMAQVLRQALPRGVLRAVERA
jgi:hypothetical protein